MRRELVMALTVVSVTAAFVHGQGCSEDPAYAVLDFWVGEWEVSAAGERVGENRIEKLLQGCAIMEHWTDVTLTPLPDGTVRQVIERSTDDGATWQSSFDAVYRRRPGASGGR